MPPSDSSTGQRLHVGQKFGPYLVEKALGQGGMGTVYKARDTRLNRHVALKICTIPDNPTAIERFCREAQAAASLRHTNLCPVYEFDVRDGIAYIAMAYIEGPHLGEWVRKHPLDIRGAANLVAKLARAMQEVHDAEVIHRDLKPGNVAMDKKGEPVILDFGLARQLDDPRSRVTQKGLAIGTPASMAPEQIQDAAQVGPAADVYSLGVMLYQFLTGELPFVGPIELVVAQTLAVTPKPPSQRNTQVKATLDAICLRAMAKKADERFHSMREFAVALERTVAREAIVPHSLPETLPDPPVARNVLGMRFVKLPKGTFYMGWDGTKKGTKTEIKENFEIAIHTVTQGQWRAVMGNNPSYFSRDGEGKDRVKKIRDEDLERFPVESVSWDDQEKPQYSVQEFIKKLNKREESSGWKYRLPAEAEWEYACRGGATAEEECSHHFYFAKPTDEINADLANFNGNYPFPKDPPKGRGTYLERPTIVGSYKPNKLGLYDMHGNVWPWCSEWYTEGSYRVLRGGSWYGLGSFCQASYRDRLTPTNRFYNAGFRLARVPVR